MSNLSTKERIKKYNSDISEMINKLTKFHEENSKITNNYNDPHSGHVGDIYNIAENLEDVLIAAGIVREEDRKYQ